MRVFSQVWSLVADQRTIPQTYCCLSAGTLREVRPPVARRKKDAYFPPSFKVGGGARLYLEVARRISQATPIIARSHNACTCAVDKQWITLLQRCDWIVAITHEDMGLLLRSVAVLLAYFVVPVSNTLSKFHCEARFQVRKSIKQSHGPMCSWVRGTKS